MNIKKLFSITSKSCPKPILNYLYVKGGKIYATDAIRAVIMNSDYDKEAEGFIGNYEMVLAEAKAKQNKSKILPSLVQFNEQYPNIEAVIPEADFSIKYNRQYLIDLLTALQVSGVSDEIELIIPKNRNLALLLKNINGTGIVMPIISHL